jgi:hypothetical protein
VTHAHNSTDILCSPYIHAFSSPTRATKCSILLTEMSSKSLSFIECWPKCLNLYMANVSQSQKVYETVSDASLHLSHSGWSTGPGLSRCPFT